MAAKKKYNFWKKGKKTAKKTYRKSSGTKTNLKKMVKMEVSRNIENKTYSTYFSNQQIYPSNSPNFQSSINPVSPYAGYMNIVQGTSQGTRIGNAIKIKSLNFKYIISPNPYDAVTNQQPQATNVIVWVFYDKSNPVNIPTIGSDFLQLGGSATALQNSLIDCTAPINTDRYRVLYKRIHKVGYNEFSGGSGTNPAAGYYSNNDYKMNVSGSINLMPYIIKNVKYNDAAATPTTRGLFIVFQAVKATVASYASTQVPCMAVLTSTMEYEDA